MAGTGMAVPVGAADLGISSSQAEPPKRNHYYLYFTSRSNLASMA
jgi:hypothetical protein